MYRQTGKITLLFIIFLSLSVEPAAAQMKVLKKVGTFIDSLSIRGVDRNYIDAPERPWQVIVRGNINQADLKLRSTLRHAEAIDKDAQGDVVWEPRIKTKPSYYTGAWVGYRGFGVGYSTKVGGGSGSIITASATGGSYGVNLRIHNFETDNPEVTFTGNFKDEEDPSAGYKHSSMKEKLPMWEPIKSRALMLDAYYLFNGKRFSYAAAYDQSVIQKRSAGSFMVGAMYYRNRVKYVHDFNAPFIFMMGNIGKMEQSQLNIGGGYAYNWVPTKGLLVSAMAMPMLSVVNHYKTWRYDSNLRQDVLSGADIDYDDPFYILSMEVFPLKADDPSGKKAVESKNSKIGLNIDGRLSVTYQWDRFFVNANGQVSRFPYRNGDIKGRLIDWYVNASVGVRL